MKRFGKPCFIFLNVNFSRYTFTFPMKNHFTCTCTKIFSPRKNTTRFCDATMLVFYFLPQWCIRIFVDGWCTNIIRVIDISCITRQLERQVYSPIRTLLRAERRRPLVKDEPSAPIVPRTAPLL